MALDVCEHGGLRHKCRICELELQLEAARTHCADVVDQLAAAERELVDSGERHRESLIAKTEEALKICEEGLRQQARAESAESHLSTARAEVERLREELAREKIQTRLIVLGRDWWILQASRVLSADKFKALRETSLDEIHAALAPRSETTEITTPTYTLPIPVNPSERVFPIVGLALGVEPLPANATLAEQDNKED